MDYSSYFALLTGKNGKFELADIVSALQQLCEVLV